MNEREWNVSFKNSTYDQTASSTCGTMLGPYGNNVSCITYHMCYHGLLKKKEKKLYSIL